ncbi:MAG: radical SAM protein [Kiritimatiellae bacterium]|nr:radical SAM protein [Kiritimatiellia bacterium]
METHQVDFSLEVALALFPREGVDQAVEIARTRKPRTAVADYLLREAEAYRQWVGPVIRFLQGQAPEFAWLFSRRGVLPEGPHFAQLDEDGEAGGLEAEFGLFGVADKAKVMASLFIDDLAQIYGELVDRDFGLARYAEHLALAAPSFDPILDRLTAPDPTPVDRLIDRLTGEALVRGRPSIVGITVPFPGTVYGAFRIAAAVRRLAPEARIVIGGGYVNSELQDLTDERVFDYVDAICYGEGFAPWLGLVGQGPSVRTRTRAGMSGAGMTAEPAARYEVPVSDYADLDLKRYPAMAETANPMHRLWSDGHWLKVQLANGCYWHRCAFCDLALDYIARYAPADARQAVDAMLAMRDATGVSAFHFTDEALPPALIRAVSEELRKRGERLVWWGNIRLDRSFTPALCGLMARAGCIGVSAGLECAQDRLLKLMNKGITCASAREACTHLADAGLLVHTYLMYGFPTQTEKETLAALRFVRDLFRDGLIHSAYWHRFALTVHSPIAKNPDAFGIRPRFPDPAGPRFALNEIPYEEPGAPDHARLGRGLALAVYNYMQGRGLDLPVSRWFA